VLVTPPVSDQILDGNTRASTVQIARDILGMKVEERPISIDETLADADEVFASGTAWTLLSVRELVHRDRPYAFPKTATREALLRRLRGTQGGTEAARFGGTLEVPTNCRLRPPLQMSSLPRGRTFERGEFVRTPREWIRGRTCRPRARRGSRAAPRATG